MYLLDNLSHRGFTWPEVAYVPELDGGVWAFLGTVDPSFDTHATSIVLEDKENEERLQARRAVIAQRLFEYEARREAEKAKAAYTDGVHIIVPSLSHIGVRRRIFSGMA